MTNKTLRTPVMIQMLQWLRPLGTTQSQPVRRLERLEKQPMLGGLREVGEELLVLSIGLQLCRVLMPMLLAGLVRASLDRCFHLLLLPSLYCLHSRPELVLLRLLETA